MSRFPTTRVRKYQLKGMKEKHQEIKRLDSLGIRHKDIAEEVGCTPENVCAITGSEVYKRELDVIRVARDSVSVDVGKRIMDIGAKGLDLLDEVVSGKGDGKNADIGLRVRAAMDALDRQPETAKVKTVQGRMRHDHVVEESVLDRIKARAAEAQQQAMQEGMVEEANYEEG